MAVRAQLLSLLLLLLAPARAPGQPVLYDPGYTTRPTRQRDGIVRHVDRIIAPTLTYPALVRSSGRLQVLLRGPDGADGRPLPASPPSRYEVNVLAQGSPPPVRGTVRRAERRGALLELEVELPPSLARDVYDLHVMGPGIDDRQATAVRVLGGSGEPRRFLSPS